MTLEGKWSLTTLRRCTQTVGVQCWGCGHRAQRVGTTPDRWIEALCAAPDCLARTIGNQKP